MSEEIEFDYIEESGPGIPELPAEVPFESADVEPEVLEVPQWERETVEQILTGLGAGAHLLAGKAEHDWEMTEADLGRIAPPLTRIMNRYEPTARLAAHADPLMVAHGFALYGWRSALERQRALRDQAEAREEPRAAYRRPSGHAAPDEDGFEATEFEPPEPGGVVPYFPQSPRARSEQ